MKKILSLVLSLALVFGSFGTVFADEAKNVKKVLVPKDVVGTNYEEAAAALMALDVVNGYEDGTYKPEKVVTRAEMAKLIVTELGLAENAKAYKADFTDLGGAKWAEGYIGYAQSLGIIDGYGNGKFGPLDEVTYNQALTMIVRALGYTKDCKEMNGTWPAIYVQKARTLDLTEGVTKGGAIGANRGDIAIFLYNALTADMGYADADGVFRNKTDKNGAKVKVIESLNATSPGAGTILTNADADNALIDVRKFVGASVEQFTVRLGSNRGNVVALGDFDSEFISGTVDQADKEMSATDGNDYDLSAVFSGAGADIVTQFKNGKVAGTTDLTALKANEFVQLAVELSGKDVKDNVAGTSTGLYTINRWAIDSTDNALNGEHGIIKADEIKSMLEEHKLFGYDFVENNGEIDMTSFDLEGVDSLNDIKAGNVVYVFANRDDITRVLVGTKTVEGEATRVKDLTDVTIDGTVYEYASEKLMPNGIEGKVTKGKIKAGDKVRITLDAFGYIYDSEEIDKDAENYAVVLETGGTTGGIGGNQQVKLLLEDGSDKIFDVDKEALEGYGAVAGFTTFVDAGKDGVAGNSDDNYAFDVTSVGSYNKAGTAVVRQLVKYGLDKNGVIDELKPLTFVTGAVKDDMSKTGYFDQRRASKDTVIFNLEEPGGAVVAFTSSDEDDYSVVKFDEVKGEENVTANYLRDGNDIVAMILQDFSNTDDVYGVVTEVVALPDDEYDVTMLVNGKEIHYTSGDDVFGGKAPDTMTAAQMLEVYTVEFDKAGVIKKLSPFMQDDSKKFFRSGTYSFAAKNLEYGDWNATLADLNDYYLDDYVFSMWSGADDVPVFTAVPAALVAPANTVAPAAVNEIILDDGNFVVYVKDGNELKKGGLSDLRAGLSKDGLTVEFLDTIDDAKKPVYNIAIVK